MHTFKHRNDLSLQSTYVKRDLLDHPLDFMNISQYNAYRTTAVSHARDNLPMHPRIIFLWCVDAARKICTIRALTIVNPKRVSLIRNKNTYFTSNLNFFVTDHNFLSPLETVINVESSKPRTVKLPPIIATIDVR